MVKTVDTLRDDLNGVSNAFLTARSECRHLDAYPGTVPVTLEDAYAIQSASIAAWPADVIGWKIGGVAPSFQDRFTDTRIAGPVFSQKISQGAAVVDMPVFEGGFAAVEAEFILKTKTAITPGSVDVDTDDLAELIDQVFIGVEIASSPLAALNDLGPCSIISDFGNNNGVLLGDEVKDWRNRDISSNMISVTINDELIGETKATPLLDGAFGSFKFLIAKCAERGITLEAGSLVSTGAITGVHKAKMGDVSTISFGALGQMNIELVKAS